MFQATLCRKMPARAEPDKLQQSSPETEPECGGITVENQKQL